jgi:hypothetical protein
VYLENYYGILEGITYISLVANSKLEIQKSKVIKENV